MRGRALLRVARWEVTAGGGGVDRRAVALAAAAVIVVGGLLPLVAGGAAAPDAGIYRAGVPAESPYRPALEADDRFVVAEPGAGPVDVRVFDDAVVYTDRPKARAAAAAVREAVVAHNDRVMAGEADGAAAFPVAVRLRYVERDVGLVRRGTAGGGDGGDGGTADGGADGATATDAGDGGSAVAAGGAALPSGGTGGFLAGRSAGSPSEIAPPFPFVSLVLAFAFVVPMNFVVQAYASSVLHERTNRRGELLLVAPVGRATLVAGKTLPYLLVMLGLAAATALAIGGGVVSVVAVVPVAGLFLACAFVGALLARSHRELTFVLVTVSVGVTTFVFVPAIFTQVHPIAAISPLTLVVRELEGAAIPLGTAAFATVPSTVAAATLFGLGLGLYREEDLFAHRPVPAKVLDALATPIRGRASAAALSAASIPFVFVAELLCVAVLFVLPLGVALPALLVLVAGVEELAKSLHVYAGVERGRYGRGRRAALTVGAASGVGFFVAEKVAVAAQIVGLGELELGRAVFELGAGTGGSAAPLVLAALLLAPLALHVGTAGLTALGASRGRRAYVLALGGAIAVHAAYNGAVVSALA